MGRVRPADIEQVIQINGIVLVGLQNKFAIARMDRRLFAGKKARADPGARRAERQGCSEAAPVGYAAGVGETASTT